ncbi:hypothetical protein cypCar_00009902 [Cyprinus carpio]|nr:hypothetical protein cypCar_00009902 [Cyprinus carpio]
MDKYTACVWPRLEPFLIGVLPATPPSKFSMHYLRKMACYVRTRDGCFPRLGWHMWRHIACGKLQLEEELNWDDQAHLTFIQTHLAELLELLVDPGQLSNSGQVLRDSQLTSEALESLSLLLEGSVSHSRTMYPIHKLLSRLPLQSQAGFSKLSRSYSLQQFQGFLQQVLCLNPFSISTCSQSGKKLAWAL